MDQIYFRFASAITDISLAEFARCFLGTRLLLAGWCIISSLEWLSNRAAFREDGLLSWSILSLRSTLLYRLRFDGAGLSERPLVALLALRIGAALLLAIGWGQAWIMLLVIIATSVVLKLRTWLGEDGADQIGQIVAIGTLIMAIGMAIGDKGMAFAGVLVIAGQLTISYFFAGFAKLMSSDWRHGRAVVGVMGTHTYGHGAAAALLAGSTVASMIACWAVIVPEILFPLTLFAPPHIFWGALALFATFHLGTAFFMGLNTFVWAFIATYPAAILLNGMIVRAGLSL